MTDADARDQAAEFILRTDGAKDKRFAIEWLTSKLMKTYYEGGTDALTELGTKTETTVARITEQIVDLAHRLKPMQPIVADSGGTVRFKRNAIIERMLYLGGEWKVLQPEYVGDPLPR